MRDTLSQLIDVLDSLPVSNWGIGDISGLHPLGEQYPRAISLALAYTPLSSEYDEAAVHELIEGTKPQLRHSVETLRAALDELKVKCLIVPSGQDDETLTGHFPFKLAATRAGLGWIGKNCLLVTEEFGPRVTLATVLVDLDLPCGKPIMQSQCGFCRVCVDSCPYGCLTGAEWRPGVDRDILIDVSACWSERLKYKESLGRRHACALCLLSCPQGLVSVK